ncbi:GNAT family N-acetyltransferase [Persicitalea sp.]|uniref:GNAT family N-acetyltransferase n=1 Tax=Persicitalea sp. TaxID=3100273 RepID=UPI003593478B
MVEATIEDKKLVVEILFRSFEDNMSVNYLIPHDSKRTLRLRELIAYSLEMCRLWGKVVISENRKACALVIFPDRKRTTLRSLLIMGRLILKSIGFWNIRKALSRENQVYAHHPRIPIYHLWFVGVLPEHQGEGIGSKILEEIMKDAAEMGRPVYLETSTHKNIPWYQKHGFSIYGKIQLSYTLFLMRSDK